MKSFDVTRGQGQGEFPKDFLRRYNNPLPQNGDTTYRLGYYGTVAELNTYGITFTAPELDASRRKLVITVEHDNLEQADMVIEAFSKWGTISDHKEQHGSVGANSQT